MTERAGVVTDHVGARDGDIQDWGLVALLTAADHRTLLDVLPAYSVTRRGPWLVAYAGAFAVGSSALSEVARVAAKQVTERSWVCAFADPAAEDSPDFSPVPWQPLRVPGGSMAPVMPSRYPHTTVDGDAGERWVHVGPALARSGVEWLADEILAPVEHVRVGSWSLITGPASQAARVRDAVDLNDPPVCLVTAGPWSARVEGHAVALGRAGDFEWGETAVRDTSESVPIMETVDGWLRAVQRVDQGPGADRLRACLERPMRQDGDGFAAAGEFLDLLLPAEAAQAADAIIRGERPAGAEVVEPGRVELQAPGQGLLRRIFGRQA